MNKYKYPILAKPSGITLEQHRNDVISETNQLVEKFPNTFQKYFRVVGKSLAKRLNCVASFHDDGKRVEKWQKACQMDYENYLIWKDKYGGTFQDYAKDKNEAAGENLRKAGVRHEFHSLIFNQDKKLSICLQAAIAAHHGKLGHKYAERWEKEKVMNIWNIFRKESNRISEQRRRPLEEVALLQYEYAGPRGLLQLCDHRASALEDGDFVPDYTPFSYKFPHQEKRNVQKLIEAHWEDDLLLIRAPTGSGKTDASLLWASKQIENRKADRLVIAMPTRFTSNALAITVTENLSASGLYHSSAWFSQFQEDVESGHLSRKKADKIHEFSRLLQTPITVCTIDHLLISLTLTREDHHLITFNLANSCLVIDEADFYDDFTQANILVLLEILRYWKVPVLLMSASLPERVLGLYQQLGYNIQSIKEDTPDNRPRFEVKSITNYSGLSEIEAILNLCVQKGNAIIYVNTVEQALRMQDWFIDKGVTTCLYHSRFSEPDKKRKEEELISMLGRRAWESGTAAGVAILTQIGEMSINISADLMVSEMCPIDRLIQRTGRLCRFDEKIGELYVLVPQKKDVIYPAPYGNYERKIKTWTPADAFIKTMEILRCETYSAEKLVELLNFVYKKQDEFSAKSLANAKNLKKYFTSNWLISSEQTSQKDDTGVNFWSSRNIPPQETVYIKIPEKSYFSNYLSFQSWKLANSIALPLYLIDKARKNHILDLKEIYIADEKENILIIRDGFYNYGKGVELNLPESVS